MDKLITNFVIWWCKKKLKQYRKERNKLNLRTTIFEIKGTGKDYPDYLMFTDNESVRNEMMEI